MQGHSGLPTREWNYSSIQKAIYPKGTRMEQNTQTPGQSLELSTIRVGKIYKFSPVIQSISTSEKLGSPKNREDPDDYYYYYYHLDQNNIRSSLVELNKVFFTSFSDSNSMLGIMRL